MQSFCRVLFGFMNGSTWHRKFLALGGRSRNSGNGPTYYESYPHL